MKEPIPITPMFDYYTRIHFKGAGKSGESTYRLRLDRELVPTRALGARLGKDRSTATGPRLDLLHSEGQCTIPRRGSTRTRSGSTSTC